MTGSEFSVTEGPVWCSCCTGVRSYQKCSKEGAQVNQWIHKLMKWFLTLIERIQITQNITAQCVWSFSFRAPEWTFWLMNTTQSSYTRHVSTRTGPWNCRRRRSDLMKHKFFCIVWRLCVCVHLTQRQDGTRMHCGKKASWWRQSDDLDTVLLRNLRSWSS